MRNSQTEELQVPKVEADDLVVLEQRTVGGLLSGLRCPVLGLVLQGTHDDKEGNDTVLLPVGAGSDGETVVRHESAAVAALGGSLARGVCW